MQLCIGGVYTWSLFNQPLANAYGWETNSVYLAYSIVIFIFAFTTIISGRLQDKFGPRKIATIGIVLYSAGLMLTSTAESLWQLYLYYSLIAGVGIGFVYVCPLSTCVKWFPDKKGFITGIAVGAFGLGGFLFNSFIQSFIESVGVSRAFFYQGIIYMIIGLIGAQLLRQPKINTSEVSDKIINDNEFTVTQMIKTKSFYLIWVIYLTGTITGLLVIGLAKDIGMDVAGLAPAIAANAVALAAIFNALGRITWGILSDKLGRLRVISVMFGLTAVAVGLLSTITPNTRLFFSIVAIIAFCFGGFLAVIPPLTSDYYGIKNLGANYGLVYQGYGIAALVGPMLISLAGGFKPAFLIAALLTIVGLILSLLVKPPLQIKPID
ncbi:MFS transporter [Marinilactibacillus psychrotolerans]|uniref:Major facilitator superfamily transporter n=1 Tax=Marinilactibacillus psychrotolerans TaxID=191770 RepID=A0AAV3WX75_9LACT|nr:MFS transporter [Marinilactibacillus psychrotolerans]GEQ36339.1 major facilitator superfamily transporter [Marinilactibacillus psychrotolerans]SDD01911.1 MFS transporter, OFA family, oxalate/formate antiporter [Marinilactibacillus psychrotolerans]